MNKFLLIAFLFITALKGYGQEKTTVTGQVLSAEDGKPIPGASVFIDKPGIGEQSSPGVIQNNVIGTITDADGRFSLQVPAGTTHLRISYLGYTSLLLNISNKSNLTVSLVSDNNVLSEVVVNGYTDIAKRKNTTSLAKVDYQNIRQNGVSGVDQMLEGQVAGVSVVTLNGGPGAAPKIKIRGTVSLNGTQDPLWVLDGLPLEGTNLPKNLSDKDDIDQLRNLPIAGLNPDDIADITILKDAAATAIYGARAANGVIVITTKKGKKGPMAVNFSANTFISERPDLSRLNLMNANQKVDFELGIASRADLIYRGNQGTVSRILNSSGELADFRENGFSALTPGTQSAINALRSNNTNWGKELYQSSVNQQYGLSLSGGTDQANYYFSTGYYKEKGTTIGTGLERYNLTLKTDFNISQKLKAGVAVFGSKTSRGNYLTDPDGYTNVSTYSRNVNPYQTVRDANGNFAYDLDILGTVNGDVYLPYNFLEERQNTRYTLGNKSVKTVMDLGYEIAKDLNIRTELGLQFEDTGVERFAGQESYNTRKLRQSSSYYNSVKGATDYFLPAGGQISNQNTSFFQYNWKSIVEYNKVFNEKHEVEALAGTELRRTYNEDVLTRGFGYNERTRTNQNIVFPNADFAGNSLFRSYQNSELENAFASLYATLSYTYDRKYTVYGSIRYDGSDLFGVDPKYRYLPIYSISGAWNAKEEQFLKNTDWISNLRFRSSYGLQGNIDKTTSPYVVGDYNSVNILPGGNQPTISVTSPPNNKLRWEKTSTFNAAVDLGVLNNAIQVTFEYYNRYSRDLIGTEALQLENGFDFTNSNFARVRNEGLELSISTRNIRTNSFSWSTDFNIANNKSKVLREKIRPNQLTPSREGYPVGAVFVLKTAGLDANGIPQFMSNGQTVSLENFYKLYDPWADFFPGELTSTALSNEEFRNLYTYAGNLDPKYTGGITNRLTYKNFDFAATAIFNLEQTMLARPQYNPAQVDRGRNYSTDILNAWSESNAYSALPGIFGKDSFDGERYMAYNWLTGFDASNSYNSLDIFSKKMSYMRISSLRFGYTLSKAISGKVKASTLRFSVEARNPFVLSTGYNGYFDPETYGNIYAQPVSRSISFGLNATF